MFYMVDNYDSFVYNLARYLEELGEEVRLVRNDRIPWEELEALVNQGQVEGILLSPGPKDPRDCGECKELVKRMAGRVPILGICLGHQIIGHVFGARVRKGIRPMHGKVTGIRTTQKGVFRGLPAHYQVTRYHSLVVEEESLPQPLAVDAWAEDGAVMGLRHRELPIYGVQFHPEAVLTEHGHALLGNFAEICREWRAE